MHIPPLPVLRSKQGYALLVVMTFMAIMLVLFSAMMFNTMSNANITKRNNQYNASEAAAQAASEKVLSQMTHDFEFDAMTNSGAWYGQNYVPTLAGDEADWPIKYTYSDANGTNNQISVNIGAETTYTVPLTSQYQGLRGYQQLCTITATATPNTGPAVPATVSETIDFAFIPLFQFAIFYNVNLEIDPGSSMVIQGSVYSNAGIWTGSTSCSFSNTVSAVGIATNAAGDPFCAGYSGTGASTYLLSGQPTSGNDTLTMPVGTSNNAASVEAIINIPTNTYAWGSAAAFTTNGQVYFANAADLFVTNSAAGTNSGSAYPEGNPTTIYYQDGAENPHETWVTNDYYLFSNNHSGTVTVLSTNVIPISFFYTNNLAIFKWTNNPTGTNQLFFAGYSFLTNVLFFDWREGWHNGSGPPKAVQAVQVDLIKFNKWLVNANATGGSYYNNLCKLSNHKSHPIDSIYVYNDVPLTSAQLPAVRVMNGGMTPTNDGTYGFTLATAMPIYVWGDYNASNSLGSSLNQNSDTYTEPAALMGDAVTILSDSWSDSNTNTMPTPTATTVNAACLEGIVESNTNSTDADNTYGYSGGLENFLRLLENWGSVNLYYNGSIVVMFPSQYATNCWQATSHYYNAPSRHWAFNTNFQSDAGMPPLSPNSQGVIRASWGVN